MHYEKEKQKIYKILIILFREVLGIKSGVEGKMFSYINQTTTYHLTYI